jgi:hypothetical protein
VIGELQNGQDPVAGYFPAAVSEEMFLKVQSKLANNRGKRPSNNGTIANLFSGVAFCKCAAPIKLTNGSAGKYITCSKLKGLQCDEPMTLYPPFEASFIDVLNLSPDELLPRLETRASANVEVLKGRN